MFISIPIFISRPWFKVWLIHTTKAKKKDIFAGEMLTAKRCGKLAWLAGSLMPDRAFEPQNSSVEEFYVAQKCRSTCLEALKLHNARSGGVSKKGKRGKKTFSFVWNPSLWSFNTKATGSRTRRKRRRPASTTAGSGLAGWLAKLAKLYQLRKRGQKAKKQLIPRCQPT